MLFPLGARVIITKEYQNYGEVGLVGTIVCRETHGLNRAGVCFDEARAGFHILDGQVPYGHGYWVPDEYLREIYNGPPKDGVDNWV